jgi:hypothetical protein
MVIDGASIAIAQDNSSSTAIGFEDAKETLDVVLASSFSQNDTTIPLLEEETQTPTITEDQDLDVGDAA